MVSENTEKIIIYSRLPITRTLKGNRKKFALSGAIARSYSFSYNGAVIWNSLSPELRQAKSLKSFEMVVAISLTESIKRTRHLCKAEFLYFLYLYYLNF